MSNNTIKLNQWNAESKIFRSNGDLRPVLSFLMVRPEDKKTIATDGHIMIEVDLPVVGEKMIEPDFAAVEKRLEGKTPVITIGLNPSKAKKVFEFLERFVDSTEDITRVVSLKFYSPTDAIVIEALNGKTGQECRVLLMPCRID
jgi:hypothetical protein